MFRSVVLFEMFALLVSTACSLDSITTPQVQAPSPALTESQARKLLADSAWAKRAKLRSAIRTQTPLPPPENPGAQPGGLGPGGPGHGVVAPASEQLAKQAEGKYQPMPCAGWG